MPAYLHSPRAGKARMHLASSSLCRLWISSASSFQIDRGRKMFFTLLIGFVPWGVDGNLVVSLSSHESVHASTFSPPLMRQPDHALNQLSPFQYSYPSIGHTTLIICFQKPIMSNCHSWGNVFCLSSLAGSTNISQLRCSSDNMKYLSNENTT